MCIDIHSFTPSTAFSNRFCFTLSRHNRDELINHTFFFEQATYTVFNVCPYPSHPFIRPLIYMGPLSLTPFITIASGPNGEPSNRHRWNGRSASVHLQDVKVKMRFGVLAFSTGRDFLKGNIYGLPSRELTYPPKMAFWRWFSFSQGGIC